MLIDLLARYQINNSGELGSFGVNIFTVRENGHVMYMLYTVLHAVATAGINSALMNIILDVVPHELRSDALAIKNTAYGFAGFFTTLAASPFVAFIQSRGNSLFGATVYAQQILSLVTFLILYRFRIASILLSLSVITRLAIPFSKIIRFA